MIVLPIFEMSSAAPSENNCSCERLRMRQKREAMQRKFLNQLLKVNPLELVLQFLDSPEVREKKLTSEEQQKMPRSSEEEAKNVNPLDLFLQFLDIPEIREKKSTSLEQQTMSYSSEEETKQSVAVQKDDFIVQIKTTDFKPDEIVVKIKDRKLSIYAKHEEKESGSFVSRELRRDFTIPPDVDPERLVAELTKDGFLNIKGVPKIPEAKQLAELQPEAANDVHLQHESKDGEEEDAGKDEQAAVRIDNFCIPPMDMNGFKPNEIVVKIKDQKINVHAKHEEAEEASGLFVLREMRREFTIPPDVDPKTIVAEFNKDGLMSIKSTPNIPENKESDAVSEKDLSLEKRESEEILVEVRVQLEDSDANSEGVFVGAQGLSNL